jgi:hypothetical protein
MSDQELTTAVRESVSGARMNVPAEQIASRGRAIHVAHRRRVAAGVTAAVSAGAAAIAAAIVLPGPPAPATQDTAYVVSHVNQALDAVPADTIMFSRFDNGSGETYEWANGHETRSEAFTATGQLTYEIGWAHTGTAITSVTIDYKDRTWWRSVTSVPVGTPSAKASAASSVCADHFLGVFPDVSATAAEFRAEVSCGHLKADGTATVGGVTAIKLTDAADAGFVWYVSSTTYLPIRATLAQPDGRFFWQQDFQWLPPTTANLANLSLPTPPQGFTRVSG